MAAAGHLEEHITCSVCLEVYRNPHALKCLHTFCLPCIRQLEQRGRVQCPECREYTNIGEIKKEFKIQSLIEFSKNVGQVSSSTSESKICEMCEDPEKKVQFQCVECNFYMCGNCEKAHKKPKATKNHKIISLQEKIKSLKSSLEKIKRELQNTKPYFSQKSRNVDTAIRDILQSQNEQLAQSKKYKDDIIKVIERYHTQTEEKIISANDQLIQLLKNGKYLCNKSEGEIQAKIDFIREMLKSDDISVLTETTENLNATIKDDIANIKQKLSTVESNVRSGVVVVKCGPFKPENVFTVQVDHDAKTFNPTADNILFPKLLQYSYKQVKSLAFDEPTSVGICSTGGKLWCARRLDNVVCDTDCNILQKIKHKQIKWVTGLTLTHQDTIILSSSHHGLHQLDTTGKYLGQIDEGHYSDVCCYQERLYVVDTENCQIITYLLIDNIWQRTKEVCKLVHGKGDDRDKVYVSSSGIHVTSYNRSSLCAYSLEGQFLYQKGSPGKFDSLQLCGVDIAGNALVRDYELNGFLVYDVTKDTWSIVRMEQLKGGIKDVLVGLQGENIWVLTSSHLFKYARNTSTL